MWVKGDIELANQHLSLSGSIEPTTQNMFTQHSVLFAQNRFQEAWEVIQQARKLASQNGDELECRWLSIPFAANTLTMVDSTDPRIDESVATASPAIEELDWPTGKAYLLMIRGFVALTRGDQSTAAESLSQSLEVCHSCGNRGALTLRCLAIDRKQPPVLAERRKPPGASSGILRSGGYLRAIPFAAKRDWRTSSNCQE